MSPTILAHISDLHFGCVNPVIADALADELRARPPHLLVVSGDLTQRARRRQFADAAAYLASLPGPQIVIPGNHDIPLYDVLRRFAWPLERYRQYITPDLAPFYSDGSIAILGISTPRPWTWSLKGFWRDGRISSEQLHVIDERFSAVAPNVFKVLVTHHPFIPPPHRRLHGVVGGIPRALDVLRRSGIDLLLAGHLHTMYSGDMHTHYEAASRSILSVQAGSATSTRLRWEPNAYNWISIEPDLVTVAARTWTGDRFIESSVTRYRKVGQVWNRDADPQRSLPAGP